MCKKFAKVERIDCEIITFEVDNFIFSLVSNKDIRV
jgi:hypothetical protein